MVTHLIFEAPADSLFLVDAGVLRVITHDGGEVVLPLCDLVAFVVHLSLQQVQVFSVLTNSKLAHLGAVLQDRA